MGAFLTDVVRGLADGLEALGRTWTLGLPAALATGLLLTLLRSR